MKWKANFLHPKNWAFEIEEDESAGFYLKIFDASGVDIADYLQDTLADAKKQAEEEYAVPLSAWQLES